MKKTAIDYVTEEVNYNRPHYDFPELSSENGNPIFYWKDAINKIQRQGFKKEAEEIILYHSTPRQNSAGYIFPGMPYEEQFNFLNKFLEFNPKEEKINEDDEYVYLKVKKGSYKDSASLKQPTLFYANNKAILEDMLEGGEDFSITNCYDRNIFHYCTNVEALEYLLEENKKHHWVNLFHLDHFGGTVLHTHNNLTSFPILLNAMYEQDPELTKLYFLNYNVFDKTASSVFISTLDRELTKPQVSMDVWQDFLSTMKIIKLVNSDIYYDVINLVKDIPFFKKMREEEEQRTNALLYNHFVSKPTGMSSLYAQYMAMMMDFNLNSKEKESKAVKHKI